MVALNSAIGMSHFVCLFFLVQHIFTFLLLLIGMEKTTFCILQMSQTTYSSDAICQLNEKCLSPFFLVMITMNISALTTAILF